MSYPTKNILLFIVLLLQVEKVLEHCKKLHDLTTLLPQHYQEDADGLCTCLGAPLPREGSTTAYSVDKSAFEQARHILSMKAGLASWIGEIKTFSTEIPLASAKFYHPLTGWLDDQEGGCDPAGKNRKGRVWRREARSVQVNSHSRCTCTWNLNREIF